MLCRGCGLAGGSLPLPTLLKLPLHAVPACPDLCQLPPACPHRGLSPPPCPTNNQIPPFSSHTAASSLSCCPLHAGAPTCDARWLPGEENSSRRTEGDGCPPACEMPVTPRPRGPGLADPSEHAGSTGCSARAPAGGSVGIGSQRAPHALLLPASEGAQSHARQPAPPAAPLAALQLPSFSPHEERALPASFVGHLRHSEEGWSFVLQRSGGLNGLFSGAIQSRLLGKFNACPSPSPRSRDQGHSWQDEPLAASQPSPQASLALGRAAVTSSSP